MQMNTRFNTIVISLFLSKFFTEKLFHNTQIIITSAKNAKPSLKFCHTDLSKNASVCCRLVSLSSRSVRLLTRQRWLKTVLPPTAVNLLAKVNGYQNRLTLS